MLISNNVDHFIYEVDKSLFTQNNLDLLVIDRRKLAKHPQ